jgi:hypothetical protein
MNDNTWWKEHLIELSETDPAIIERTQYGVLLDSIGFIQREGAPVIRDVFTALIDSESNRYQQMHNLSMAETGELILDALNQLIADKDLPDKHHDKEMMLRFFIGDLNRIINQLKLSPEVVKRVLIPETICRISEKYSAYISKPSNSFRAILQQDQADVDTFLTALDQLKTIIEKWKLIPNIKK